VNHTPEELRAMGGYILQTILGATVLVAVIEDVTWLIIACLVLLVCQRVGTARGR